jgi:hypothetical protein
MIEDRQLDNEVHQLQYACYSSYCGKPSHDG